MLTAITPIPTFLLLKHTSYLKTILPDLLITTGEIGGKNVDEAAIARYKEYVGQALEQLIAKNFAVRLGSVASPLLSVNGIIIEVACLRSVQPEQPQRIQALLHTGLQQLAALEDNHGLHIQNDIHFAAAICHTEMARCILSQQEDNADAWAQAQQALQRLAKMNPSFSLSDEAAVDAMLDTDFTTLCQQAFYVTFLQQYLAALYIELANVLHDCCQHSNAADMQQRAHRCYMVAYTLYPYSQDIEGAMQKNSPMTFRRLQQRKESLRHNSMPLPIRHAAAQSSVAVRHVSHTPPARRRIAEWSPSFFRRRKLSSVADTERDNMSDASYLSQLGRRERSD